jgi:hypothetical protein
MANKIRAMFIFEMMGKPPEYIKETLESHVKNLETEDIKIISKKIHDCKMLENDKIDVKGLYSTFAEVELEVDNINLLFGIVFRMLPSHIEILEPADCYLKNFDLSAIMSELAIKLHKYDEVAKVLMMERDNFARKLNYISDTLSKNVKVEEIKSNEIKVENKKEEKRSKKNEKNSKLKK